MLVKEDGLLVGVAPFFLQHGRFGLTSHRLLAAGHTHHLGIVAREDRVNDVARVVAATLAERDAVDVVGLEGIDGGSPLVEIFAASSRDGRPHQVHVDSILRTSAIELPATLDDWLAGRSPKFRAELRRRRRRFAEAGGTVRLIESKSESAAALESLISLHRARWADRGDRTSLSPEVARAVQRAVADLPIVERWRLWMAELDGVPVGANLYFVAGGTLTSYLSGFDAAYARFSPVMLIRLAAIEDACARGERIIDFGGGDNEAKRQLANSTGEVRWVTLFVHGERYYRARVEALPKALQSRLRSGFRLLPAPVQRPLRIDVIGHELTHGVTQYEANLTYSGQSGGAERVDLRRDRHPGQAARPRAERRRQSDWLIGADIVGPTLQPALRSMKEPGHRQRARRPAGRHGPLRRRRRRARELRHPEPRVLPSRPARSAGTPGMPPGRSGTPRCATRLNPTATFQEFARLTRGQRAADVRPAEYAGRRRDRRMGHVKVPLELCVSGSAASAALQATSPSRRSWRPPSCPRGSDPAGGRRRAPPWGAAAAAPRHPDAFRYEIDLPDEPERGLAVLQEDGGGRLDLSASTSTSTASSARHAGRDSCGVRNGRYPA